MSALKEQHMRNARTQTQTGTLWGGNHGRRQFMQGALGGLLAYAGASPLARLAHAGFSEGKDRFYLFCYFDGAWDILLGLDPRDPKVFNNSTITQTLIEPAYTAIGAQYDKLITPNGGPFSFGPFIGDLAQHSDKLCIVRGMSMETLTHPAGRARFLTGKVPSGIRARGSSAATWLASTLGREQTIPNLAVSVDSYNTSLPSYASGLQVSNVQDLTRALSRTNDALPKALEQQVAAFLSGQAACPSALRSPLKTAAEDSRRRAQATVSAGLENAFDFLADTTEMNRTRERYNITPNIRGLSEPGAQAAMAVRALTSGISRCVTVRLAAGLDTHFENWATDQGPTQETGFNALAAVLSDLDSQQFKGTGETWLDHTIVVAFSEFSRTPMLNPRGGRDHSLTNACVLAGGGIARGKLIGASSDVGMTPQEINLVSGALDPEGVVVRPEHIWQALFEQAGLTDEPDLRVSPLTAIFAGT